MISLLFISLALVQVAPDSLLAVQKSAHRARAVKVEETGSAALYLLAPDAAYTQAGITWNGRSETVPLFKEEGRSRQEGQIGLNTLVRLDSLQAVRGSVRYTNGVKRDVFLNSSSDFFLVYPYVVADTVGGRVNREEYAFSGGYSARHRHFYWGVEGSYRALHEYRMVDPRPRNIVSDLQVSASAGYLVLPGYALDLTLGYRRYSQTQSMSFMSERGKNSSVFHLTGLGNTFARFTGATDSYMNTRYSGNGFSVGLAWAPVAERGWEAGMQYSMLDNTHYLPSLNQVPYTELYTRNAEVRGAYLSRRGAWSWKAGFSFKGEWREGLESILDNGSAGYLKVLGRFRQFSSRQLSADVHGTLEWKERWRLKGQVEYVSYRSGYVYPASAFSLSGLTASLEASCRLRKGLWFFLPALQAGLYRPVPGWKGGASFHAERQLTARMSLYAQAALQMGFVQGYGPGFRHNITLGICF